MGKCINCSKFLSCDFASETLEECDMFVKNINHIPMVD